jgi:hypothetical protein
MTEYRRSKRYFLFFNADCNIVVMILKADLKLKSGQVFHFTMKTSATYLPVSHRSHD